MAETSSPIIPASKATSSVVIPDLYFYIMYVTFRSYPTYVLCYDVLAINNTTWERHSLSHQRDRSQFDFRITWSVTHLSLSLWLNLSLWFNLSHCLWNVWNPSHLDISILSCRKIAQALMFTILLKWTINKSLFLFSLSLSLSLSLSQCGSLCHRS